MPSSLITILRSNMPAKLDLGADLSEHDPRDLLHALSVVLELSSS